MIRSGTATESHEAEESHRRTLALVISKSESADRTSFESAVAYPAHWTAQAARGDPPHEADP